MITFAFNPNDRLVCHPVRSVYAISTHRFHLVDRVDQPHPQGLSPIFSCDLNKVIVRRESEDFAPVLNRQPAQQPRLPDRFILLRWFNFYLWKKIIFPRLKPWGNPAADNNDSGT